jgi:hypothetical protein
LKRIIGIRERREFEGHGFAPAGLIGQKKPAES